MSYRRASLDTWSDLSSDTTNGTEYSYTTDPGWAADAVLHTPTGIELNFERLNSLCVSESLPSRITIDVLPFPASMGSRIARHELPADDTIESTHFTTPAKNISKLNGSKTGPWTQQSKGQEAKPVHPKISRKESIVEQEIRLQTEREKELTLERQMAKTKLSTPTEEKRVVETSLSIDTLPSPSPSLGSEAQCSPVEFGARPVTTPKLTSQKSKSKLIYQLNTGQRSPSVDISDSSISSPWYTSESPIARDIRTTHEREEALRVTRRQSCQPSPPEQP